MRSISLMIKPVSDRCNMTCEYCFYRDVTEHREQSTLGLMTPETARRLVDSALDFADGGPVAFAFQGGEPTLRGREFFEDFTRYVTERNHRNSQVFYSLQTNGTQIDDDWAKLLAKHQFLVGLSLDGNARHNRFRTLRSGANSFDKISAAANILRQHGAQFNILTVLTGNAARNGEEIYKYFRSQDFRYLQFIPCVSPFDEDFSGEIELSADDYGDFLIRVFNLYVKDYVRGNYMSVRQFDNWVRLFLNQQPEQCGMLGHCTPQFVAEGNGNIYPCDFYCVDEWLLGNIHDGDFLDFSRSPLALEFIKESLPIEPRCRQCPFFGVCRGGGCKRTRRSADYCAAYKRFFSACLPLFRVFRNEQPVQ